MDQEDATSKRTYEHAMLVARKEVTGYDRADARRENFKELNKERQRALYKCSSCTYGRWIADVLYCPFRTCARERLRLAKEGDRQKRELIGVDNG